MVAPICMGTNLDGHQKRKGETVGSGDRQVSVTTLWQEAREAAGLAVPVVIGQLSVVGMQSTDVALVGHFDPTSLAGMALGHTVSSFVLLIGLGVASAISPMVSQAYGAAALDARQYKYCGRALGQGLWVVVVVGLVCLGILQNGREILILTGQDPHQAEIAQQYLNTLSFSFPTTLAFFAIRQFVEGISLTRPAMLISLGGLGLNAILGYGLLTGAYGLPRMGVAGTGLGTTLVSLIMCLILSVYVFGGSRFAQYGVRQVLEGPAWTEIKRVLVIGLPISVAFAMEVGAFVAAALMMGWLGPVPVAAHQVVLSLASMTFMVPLGISIAGSIRVGQAVGRQDPSGIRWAGWTAFGLCAAVMLVNAGMFLLIPDFLLGIYTAEAEVQALGRQLIVVAAAFQLFDGLQVAGNGVLRGIKDTRFPMLISTVAFWGVGVPIAYLLGIRSGHGPVGLWWGLCAGLGVAAVCHMMRFAWKTRA